MMGKTKKGALNGFKYWWEPLGGDRGRRLAKAKTTFRLLVQRGSTQPRRTRGVVGVVAKQLHRLGKLIHAPRK